jgi:hypothetical protein
LPQHWSTLARVAKVALNADGLTDTEQVLIDLRAAIAAVEQAQAEKVAWTLKSAVTGHELVGGVLLAATEDEAISEAVTRGLVDAQLVANGEIYATSAGAVE